MAEKGVEDYVFMIFYDLLLKKRNSFRASFPRRGVVKVEFCSIFFNSENFCKTAKYLFGDASINS